MTTSTQPLHILILFYLSTISLALAPYENQFIYNGFHDSTNLRLDGLAKLHPNGLLQLTDTSKDQIGHAFYQIPLQFNTSSPMLASPLSFSTTFVFAIVPESTNFGGHGIVFVISPSMDFTHAMAKKYLGLFNFTNNGLSSNHVFAIELDTFQSTDFYDINDNHVGIDVNSLNSSKSTTAAYFDNVEGKNKNLSLVSGEPMQIWIDYDGFAKLINVTLAPTNIPKPTQPLLSATIDLSLVLLDSMYVGFSSSTGQVASNHYVLGWSFSKSEEAQELDLSKLPSFPRLRRSGKRPIIHDVMISILAVAVSVIIVSGIVYVLRRKKYEELSEEWEKEYRPQRFTYKDLYQATKGFNEKGLLGVGGFGKVYSGILPRSNIQVAIKKVSHDSAQGMKEFVSEIVCMGKLRHRNLVQLLGYCRRRGELLLVYDFMPNGSLDKFLLGNEKPNLNWAQRYRILKGIASGLLYLHEEWEQVVLHRDVKASNVLLDGDLNGRLGDFGLARLYDHGANPQTTRVVGTVGYIAPELTKTGKATTSTDVFAFGTFMLEVACGRRPLEVLRPLKEMVLIDWVFECSKEGAILQTSDPRLGGEYVVEEMELALKLGLLCSHSDPEARPSMRQVMQYLDGESVLSEIALETTGGFGSAAMVNGASDELNMTFPSSSGNDSICYASTSSSILSRGR